MCISHQLFPSEERKHHFMQMPHAGFFFFFTVDTPPTTPQTLPPLLIQLKVLLQMQMRNASLPLHQMIFFPGNSYTGCRETAEGKVFRQYLHELTAEQKKTVRRLLPVLSLPQPHCDCRGFLRRKSQDIKIQTHFFFFY